MYTVKIVNGENITTIHGNGVWLKSGKISKGINTIDSFTFSMMPNNPGFNFITEFNTLVNVYDNEGWLAFAGRVLYSETTMDESGLITKTVTCENVLGYLCDSIQPYVDTQNWTVAGLLKYLIDTHNSQVEEYKHFTLGRVTARDSNNNLYQAVQRENTWSSIQSKLIDKIGGELRVRVNGDVMYLDYLDQIGEDKETEIALSVNMKSITREQDPTSFVTRLIPLGCKLMRDGEETEHRLDIREVNGGVIYIDDAQALEAYGVHVGVVEWDDVTDPSNLLNKGRAWLEENNRVQVRYSITALDLSLIGLAMDDFEVGNTHPVKNALLGIDDSARIIKKSIDICEQAKSTIEVGDNFKTLSEMQIKQQKSTADSIAELKQNSNVVVEGLESTKKELGDLSQTLAAYNKIFLLDNALNILADLVVSGDITGNKVTALNFNVDCAEEWSENIAEADDVRSIIQGSKVYKYNRKDKTGTEYGLILERECPEELKTGDGVDAFTMLSMLWHDYQRTLTEKQELAERVAAIEEQLAGQV